MPYFTLRWLSRLSSFLKKWFMGTVKVSKSLDEDKARPCVFKVFVKDTRRRQNLH